MLTVINPKTRVLFVCTGNSCRSQMAEGLLRCLGVGDFEVHSAGIQPWTLHPLAVRAMVERGIDISRQYSKSVEQYRDQSFDYVITVCDIARELCPLDPGEHRRVHWSVSDPVDAEGTFEERMKVFRFVRDDLEERIKEWFNDLGSDSGKT